ncbi:hypothetical protein ACVIGB_002227 [Bradyrhizobium sp. USDA 4341]|uniref:hypothetical protein n=1 Tax=Bradyrhizobium erythrophlei TaxID=1437360 RepID=UPI000B8829B9|nr:hypothetical protein [Bradyrhizobium erythrophlei]
MTHHRDVIVMRSISRGGCGAFGFKLHDHGAWPSSRTEKQSAVSAHAAPMLIAYLTVNRNGK